METGCRRIWEISPEAAKVLRDVQAYISIAVWRSGWSSCEDGCPDQCCDFLPRQTRHLKLATAASGASIF
jgi:hypothetical protein